MHLACCRCGGEGGQKGQKARKRQKTQKTQDIDSVELEEGLPDAYSSFFGMFDLKFLVGAKVAWRHRRCLNRVPAGTFANQSTLVRPKRGCKSTYMKVD